MTRGKDQNQHAQSVPSVPGRGRNALGACRVRAVRHGLLAMIQGLLQFESECQISIQKYYLTRSGSQLASLGLQFPHDLLLMIGVFGGEICGGAIHNITEALFE